MSERAARAKPSGPLDGRRLGSPGPPGEDSPQRRLLIVEDEDVLRLTIRHFFRERGFEVLEASRVSEALAVIGLTRPDIAILDDSLPDGTGLELLPRLKAIDTTLPAIVLTGHGSIELAVAAIKAGAEQFLTKPLEMAALAVVVDRLLEQCRLRKVTAVARARGSRRPIDPFAGTSSAIRQLAERARRVAAAHAPVLVLGETGTGKGVLAHWLHENSLRAEEAFVEVNSAGLSKDLLESELFGHERGAFTGAVTAKPGLLEMAHRGTLFLDEIGDVDLAAQAKLLKVIEEFRFRRLGEVRDREVDARLIAATHRDLPHMIAEGLFREDLYFRIHALPLTMPPLRERGDDVIVIARNLLARMAVELGRPGLRLSPATEKALLRRRWPGNVRELRNALEHAALLSSNDTIEPGDLTPASITEGGAAAPSAYVPGGDLSLDAAERRHIERVLAMCDGNVPNAARELGVSRSALYVRLRKHHISIPRTDR
jgi:DNA-binding NtrC family response regulator